MTKNIILLIVALCCLNIPSAHATIESQTITVSADRWCPINCLPNSPQEGIGIDLLKAIFEPLGYQIHYQLKPWTRALDSVHEGEIDAVVGANISDAPSLIFPHTSFYGITCDFYALNETSLPFDGLNSLTFKRLGVIAGYSYEKTVDAFIARQKRRNGAIQEVAGEDALEQNIRKLIAGRIDVIVESKPVMQYTLTRLKLTHRIHWIGSVPQGELYIGFSPKLDRSKALARIFDEGMARLKAANALPALYARYGLRPPESLQ